jgi:osmoprotectant transport system ATP-binding protein
MSATLRFDGVTVRYPGASRNALEEISFTVPAGSLTAVVGPSGCGKSTLLRTVNRMIEVERGTVLLDDRPITESDPVALRRGIGYVIQAIGLFPHMTVAENVAVVPRLLGWEHARIAERIDEVLELVRLDPRRVRDRRPAQLSGGEQQRVGVARALAAYPRLLLMDEPFGAVDAVVRASLQDEMRAIVHDAGTTTLLVTHDVDEALRLADRIALLRDGRLVQEGTPAELLLHPADDGARALLNADDPVRRLQVLRVRDAVRPDHTTRTLPTIAATASLREGLVQLLNGAPALAVIENGTRIGTIDFEALRAVLVR